MPCLLLLCWIKYFKSKILSKFQLKIHHLNVTRDKISFVYNLDSVKKSHKWMRKFNVSMDMFGNTKERERKEEKGSRKCYYEDLSLSWQGSINALLACFFCSFFLWFSFRLEKVFVLWHNDMIIYWVGQGISSLTQWHDNPINIVEVIKGFHMNLALRKSIHKIIWKLPKMCFEA